MLELPDHLPPGALCDGGADLLAETLAGMGAHWWAGADLSTDATGAVTGWADRLGGTLARPTGPSTGNGLTGAAGDLVGLQCRDGLHCGLMAGKVTKDATSATLAARYLPPWGEDAKTVMAFNSGGVAKRSEFENCLFLSETAGVVTVKDDKGLVDLTFPAPDADLPRVILVSLSGDRLAIEVVGEAKAEAQASAPVLFGPANLFIGCRNQRAGLTKTLGGALIADVWLWPGRALLMSDAPADRAALMALRRFVLWSDDAG
ncbi:hypothetical protein [Roseicyclus mahoneyensis]|uniref:Uncharacterized protein n=1 Tax=Roseicyclus mahoneyensis TaxID=164332 RepID=A0A316GJN2_9RHOB|nr:hypothetical protein [Roseicyclus mahoneyensis]PWK59622.1 hypothetical protein C7455_107167 [Roseicyclus mahoneyensis]